MKTSVAQRKKDAAVYRKAARRIERGENLTACFAIEAVTNIAYTQEPLCDRMRSIFAPDSEKLYWLGGIVDGNHDHGDKQGRILALCFMAAMVEAGDA